MNIEKLPSGKYRIRQMVNGKMYRITLDHKPKKYEIEELLHDKIYGKENALPYNSSVMELAEKYVIQCRDDGKSPATINSYKSMIRNTPDWFLDSNPIKISVDDYQKMIDEYASNHSPKSTKNINGFYKCVFADLSHIKNSSIKLPKRVKKAEYEPTTKDVMAILDYVTGTDYECVIRLATIGLRRGEACAITSKDLDADDVLTINKDMVYNGSEYVLKDHPKTTASNRRIKIPHKTAELIRKQGKAFSGYPNSVCRYLHSVQDALEIPRFRLHILRHYAAAYLHKNGFTDKQIMAYMGWDTIATMHQVYNYNLDPNESQQNIVDVFDNL